MRPRDRGQPACQCDDRVPEKTVGKWGVDAVEPGMLIGIGEAHDAVHFDGRPDHVVQGIRHSQQCRRYRHDRERGQQQRAWPADREIAIDSVKHNRQEARTEE